MGEGYKSNHFVPVAYLQKWAIDDVVKIFIKKDKIVVSDIPNNVAHKKNLYTLPDQFRSDNKKIVETVLLNIFENGYCQSVRALENQTTLKDTEIANIIGFMIVQNARTMRTRQLQNEQMKFLQMRFEQGEMAKRITDAMSLEVWQRHFSLSLSAYILLEYPKIVSISSLDILVAPPQHNFITSDHPSSAWIRDGDSYKLVEFVNANYDENDLYIYCPLTPRFCGRLNVASIKNKQYRQKIRYQEISTENIGIINKMIQRASDKVLIFKYEIDRKYLE